MARTRKLDAAILGGCAIGVSIVVLVATGALRPALVALYGTVGVSGAALAIRSRFEGDASKRPLSPEPCDNSAVPGPEAPPAARALPTPSAQQHSEIRAIDRFSNLRRRNSTIDPVRPVEFELLSLAAVSAA